MNAAEPWENLRFLKKVEVLPGAGCNWGGATFTGWGDTAQQAQVDADSQAINHAHSCSSNPANQE